MAVGVSWQHKNRRLAGSSVESGIYASGNFRREEGSEGLILPAADSSRSELKLRTYCTLTLGMCQLDS